MGFASKKINIITCQNALECPEGGVPAWKIDKKREIIEHVSNKEENYELLPGDHS
jgi:hypothetical protein